MVICIRIFDIMKISRYKYIEKSEGLSTDTWGTP